MAPPPGVATRSIRTTRAPRQERRLRQVDAQVHGPGGAGTGGGSRPRSAPAMRIGSAAIHFSSVGQIAGALPPLVRILRQAPAHDPDRAPTARAAAASPARAAARLSTSGHDRRRRCRRRRPFDQNSTSNSTAPNAKIWRARRRSCPRAARAHVVQRAKDRFLSPLQVARHPAAARRRLHPTPARYRPCA